MCLCFSGWDDVGDFASLADLLPAEMNQTRILGDTNLGKSDLLSMESAQLHVSHTKSRFTLRATVITEQCAGGIVVPASGRLVACLGVDDLVIVDTNDALLITTRARCQEVKKIVSKVKQHGWKSLV